MEKQNFASKSRITRPTVLIIWESRDVLKICDFEKNLKPAK